MRILGAGTAIPVAELGRFMSLMWFGFWLNAVSGVALLAGYPTKALTNPVFALKLLLIVVALVLLKQIARRVFAAEVPAPDAMRTTRMLAVASLACWTGAIVAGRFLAYTYTRLMASDYP